MAWPREKRGLRRIALTLVTLTALAGGSAAYASDGALADIVLPEGEVGVVDETLDPARGDGQSVFTKGWNQVGDSWYWCVSTATAPSFGWLELGNERYWLDPDRAGALAMGSFEAEGARYIADEEGAVKRGGWIDFEGARYYAASSGALERGWFELNDEWYWLDRDDYALRTGMFEVDGAWYCTKANNSIVEGDWALHEGEWYFADASGALVSGWKDWGGQRYWFDPATKAMKTGWLELDGARYWLGDSGAVARGSFVLDGALRLADAQGRVFCDAAGWQFVGGRWYHVGEGGVLSTGWIDLGSSRYFLNGSGVMQTGWVQRDGAWYYLKSDGRMATQWVQVGGSWYWLDPSTGVMQTGWLQLSDGWYWLRSSGAMATGWINLDGSAYKLDQSGRWVENPGKVLNVSRERLVEWLWSHESDGYYVGTPYSSGFSIPTCTYPNGAPRWDGYTGMNCTGMVVHGYSMAGGIGDLNAIGATNSHSPWQGGPGGGSYINAWRWYGYAVSRGAEIYTFDSVASMLASGKADKGDILFFKTNGPIDCHIGFFWGDTPYENKMWHQIYPYNLISTCFNNANKNELYQQTVLIKGC